MIKIFILKITRHSSLALSFFWFNSCSKSLNTRSINEKVMSKGIQTLNLSDSGFQVANAYVWANDKVLINPELFGVNNDWSKITDASFPSFAFALDSINYHLLRFPGGWESEYYNWDSNTTPGWSSSPSQPGASASTLVSDIPNFTVVVPTAAAMNDTLWSTTWWNAVAALKDSAVKAINKVGANNVKIVELGNEWWLQWGGGVSRSDKLRKYVKTVMNIADYISQQFPDKQFKLLINGDYTVPSEFATMKTEFTKAYASIDGVALHTYAGYNTATNNIDSIGIRIQECANNFNPDRNYVYLSEWAPSKDYNNNKIYMQAANIIPDIIQIYARSRANAACYWPPINSSAPGIGLFNVNYNITYPCGQILGELAKYYNGYAVNTSFDSIHVAAARNDSNTLTLFVMGSDQPSTLISIKVYGFTATSIQSVTKFRPNDYAHTDAAVPYVTEPSSAILDTVTNKVSFNINSGGSYEIYKIILQQ